MTALRETIRRRRATLTLVFLLLAATLHGVLMATMSPATQATGPPPATTTAGTTAVSAEPESTIDPQGQALLGRADMRLGATSPLDLLVRYVAQSFRPTPRIAYRFVGVVLAPLSVLLLWLLLVRWPSEPVRRSAPLLAALGALHPCYAQAAGVAPAGAIAVLGIVLALWLYRLHASAKLPSRLYIALLALVALATLRLFEAIVLTSALLALSVWRGEGATGRAKALPATTVSAEAPGAAVSAGPRTSTVRFVVLAAMVYVFREPLGDLISRWPVFAKGGLPWFAHPPQLNPSSVASFLMGAFGLDVLAFTRTFGVRLVATLAVTAGGVAFFLLAREAWRAAVRQARESPPKDGLGLPSSAVSGLVVAFGTLWLFGAAPETPVLKTLLGMQASLAQVSPFDRDVAPWVALTGTAGLVLLLVRSGLWKRPLAQLEGWVDRRADLDLAALGVAAYLALARTPGGFGGWGWPAILVSVVLVRHALAEWWSGRAGRTFEVGALVTITTAAVVRLMWLSSPAANTMFVGGGTPPPLADLGAFTPLVSVPAAVVTVVLALLAGMRPEAIATEPAGAGS